MAKERLNFTQEFAAEAVRRILAERRSLAEVACDLGPDESLLWSRKTALASGASRPSTA